ncbi:hypothetical protein BS78_02G157700 [Paspalum vaginatum]|nr:hypothetical protein BS78_02G157700 [Paspalum vaginatum]
MDDLDDPDFWVPPVGSRWDDDDGKDRWESSPGKNISANNGDSAREPPQKPSRGRSPSEPSREPFHSAVHCSSGAAELGLGPGTCTAPAILAIADKRLDGFSRTVVLLLMQQIVPFTRT